MFLPQHCIRCGYKHCNLRIEGVESGRPEFLSCFQLHSEFSPNMRYRRSCPPKINKKVRLIRKDLTIHKTQSLPCTLKMTFCNNNNNYCTIIYLSSLIKIQEEKSQVHVKGQKSRISKNKKDWEYIVLVIKTHYTYKVNVLNGGVKFSPIGSYSDV